MLTNPVSLIASAVQAKKVHLHGSLNDMPRPTRQLRARIKNLQKRKARNAFQTSPVSSSSESEGATPTFSETEALTPDLEPQALEEQELEDFTQTLQTAQQLALEGQKKSKRQKTYLRTSKTTKWRRKKLTVQLRQQGYQPLEEIFTLMQQSTGDETWMSVASDSDVDCVQEATEEVDDLEQDSEQENGHKIFVLVRQLSISSKCLNRETYRRIRRMRLRAIGTLRVSGTSWMMSWDLKLERCHVWHHSPSRIVHAQPLMECLMIFVMENFLRFHRAVNMQALGLLHC